MAKNAVERVIYDNYDIYGAYSDEAVASSALCDGYPLDEDEIWEECRRMDEENRELEYDNLRNFFDSDKNSTWLLIGSCEVWHGTYEGGFTFKTFDEMISKAGKDCDYFRFWDENGHFYLKCSHHDGTNVFEVKKLTKSGKQLLENWEYNDTKRYNYPEKELHHRLFKRYSVLPNYMNTMYGCNKTEYQKAG